MYDSIQKIFVIRKIRKGNLQYMNIKIYTDGLPSEAKEIREAVFVEEQGFLQEFDQVDETAVHIVLYDDGQAPVATCRIFRDQRADSYIIGRLAVVRGYRDKKIGGVLLRQAEQYIVGQNGQSAALCAQCRVMDFYRKCGYTPYGEVKDDEGCPHIWMRKPLVTQP